MKKLVASILLLIFIIIPHTHYYGENNPSITVINSIYEYQITIPSYLYTDSNLSDNTYYDRQLILKDRDGLFTATLSCEKLDSSAMQKLREYFNDQVSTEEELFDAYCKLKTSYFNALKENYKREFLFGGNDIYRSESNLKVFGEYNEILFDQKATIVLFNIIKSDVNGSTEETRIDISIPVKANRIVYTIGINLKAGSLTNTVLQRISGLIESFRIDHLPEQKAAFRLLYDVNAVNSANLGIYPDMKKLDIKYETLSDKVIGYKLSYPATLVPHVSNHIFDHYSYRSFKINYNHSFTVTVEPAAYNTSKAIREKVNLLKSYYSSMEVIKEGYVKLGKNRYTYIKYKLSSGNQVEYYQDYFILNNYKLYNVRLTSRFTEPSEIILAEFKKLLTSLEFIRPKITSPARDEAGASTQYTNRIKGYSFFYPENWEMTKKLIRSKNFELFNIKNDDFSGPLDIIVSEAKLNEKLSNVKLLKLISSNDLIEVKKYIDNYTAPYIGKTSKPLLLDYYTSNGATYFVKLINYLDINGRGKLSYSVDILYGKKLYSLFVTVSDYLTVNGQIADEELSKQVNSLIQSFTFQSRNMTLSRK